MPKILFNSRLHELVDFVNEEELERTVVDLNDAIFGDKTVYFDVKRKVKSKKGQLGAIPDGYIISLVGNSLKLFIVENEISEHDELAIGQQIMKYQATFKEGQYKTKRVLQQEAKSNESVRKALETLVKETSFPNASELLDEVVFRQQPGYVVVIDAASERLREVLKTLKSPPEVIEISKYVLGNQTMYYVSDFEFARLGESTSKKVKTLGEVDTVVCPARPSGFKKVFMAQNRWYAIRMSSAMIPQIKYIAMYEIKPYSGIRWIGYVQDIRPFEDTGKYDIILRDKERLANPLRLTPEEGKRGVAPRAPRYTKMELIKKAKKLSDIF
jgi:hypothetical protein